MSAIRRFAVGKMPIIAMYVTKCIQQRRHYMDTGKRIIQMMYVMLYFCIVCKLYEFLTYIMYIWTKMFHDLHDIVLYYRQKNMIVLKVRMCQVNLCLRMMIMIAMWFRMMI